MKVLIHALGATMGGGVRHLTNFLPELGDADRENEYVVLARSAMKNVPVASNVRLELVPDSVVGGRFKRVYSDTFEIPRKIKNEGFDAVVSLMNFGPIWSPVPHVLFQRNSIYYCPYYMRTAPRALKVEALARRRLASASMTRATVIVTPSNAMQAMIRDACPETRDCNFRTLYHGFDAEASSEALDARYAAMIDKSVGPRLFFPSHPAHHKGFDIIFRALAILRERGRGQDATLFTTIEHADWPPLLAEYERQLASLGIRDRVVFMGRVPQSQMPPLYQRSDLMVYPSLCESFGFSMVEAMGYGLPIVAAGTAANREMCGDGALYYEPLDPVSAADQIAHALTAPTREVLHAKGLGRIAGFDWSWKRYAREFVRIVNDV
jgi:glycosyltransferase involved in cell wall biosynthesis